MKAAFRSLLATFFIFTCAANSWAEDGDASVCNGCSDVVLQTRAMDLGNGHHYFYDFVYRRLTHYLVRGIEIPLATGVGSVVNSSERFALNAGSTSFAVASNGAATKVVVTNGEQAIFNWTQQIYDNEGTVELVAITPISMRVDGGGALATSAAMRGRAVAFNAMPLGSSAYREATAFDVVESPVIKDAAINQALSRAENGLIGVFAIGTRKALVNMMNYLSIPFIKTPVTLMDRVVLSDGSYFDISFDYSLQRYVYVDGSARDSIGNHIPENNSNAGGGPGGKVNYWYPDTPEGRAAGEIMVGHLGGLGIRLPGGVPMNNGYMIACVGTPTGTSCSVVLLGR